MNLLMGVVPLHVLCIINEELLVLEPHHEVDAPLTKNKVDRLGQEEVKGIAVPVELILFDTVDQQQHRLITLPNNPLRCFAHPPEFKYYLNMSEDSASEKSRSGEARPARDGSDAQGEGSNSKLFVTGLDGNVRNAAAVGSNQ